MQPMFRNPNDKNDNSRLLIAILISMVILFGFHFIFEKPQIEKMKQQQAAQQATIQAQKPAAVAVSPQGVIKPRADVLNASRRIQIEGERVSGSISLIGARLDDLSLKNHFTSVERTENVHLLSPSQTADAYYVESGWVAADKAVNVPNDKTQWSVASDSASILKTGGEITLQWDNGQGLLFLRTIALDNQYMFTVTQKIVNRSGSDKVFNAFHLISRHNLPHDFSGFFILHEGPVGFLGDKLQDPQYKDLAKGEKIEIDNTKGWLGITDKYWLVNIFAKPDETFNARMIGSKDGNKQVYQVDMVTDTHTVAAGQTIEDVKYIFAGVKNLNQMEVYAKQYGFKNIDLTFDFGMWYFITKPFFMLLHFLMSATGYVGLGILCMTVVVRAAVFPLASKAFRSMAGMKKIAPQLKELQEKYPDDRQKLQIEIFELYKKEKVNPFSGCWPMLVQIPIFFALYKAILLSVELRHAPFWGWIHDLSAKDPTSMFNLFGLIPWTPPAFLMIGAWPLLFCLTMIIQKRLSPPMPDKIQEQLQSYFPYIITFMLANFASGLVIYWTWSNVLGILQQYYIMKKTGEEGVSLIHGHTERRKSKKPAKEK